MKKILYIINVDWFFISHFLPVGIESINRGYEVHIACGLTDKEEYLKSKGFIVHTLNLSRSGTSILKEFTVMTQIYKIIKRINPDVLEFLTIKPVLYGGIISKLLSSRRKKVFYITGLGYLFMKEGFKGGIIKSTVKYLYKIAILGNSTTVITENIFDYELIKSLNVIKENQIKVIRGAGVDLKEYAYKSEPIGKLIVVMASRLLKDKGVFEYVAAAKILKEKGLDIHFKLYGDIDRYNPASLTNAELELIKREGYVTVYGFSNEIATIFSNSNIIVLPSYREGLPKVLIEAAAAGRAIVTTDVPGCRDAIEVNKTGLLCKVKNAKSLAEQIEKLVVDVELRNIMGKNGRVLAEKEFAIQKIVKKHCDTYAEVDNA